MRVEDGCDCLWDGGSNGVAFKEELGAWCQREGGWDRGEDRAFWISLAGETELGEGYFCGSSGLGVVGLLVGALQGAALEFGEVHAFLLVGVALSDDGDRHLVKGVGREEGTGGLVEVVREDGYHLGFTVSWFPADGAVGDGEGVVRVEDGEPEVGVECRLVSDGVGLFGGAAHVLLRKAGRISARDRQIGEGELVLVSCEGAAGEDGVEGVGDSDRSHGREAWETVVVGKAEKTRVKI